MLRKLLTDYGMILVLIALCVLFSCLTVRRRMVEGAAAVTKLVERVSAECEPTDLILAVGAMNTSSAPVAEDVGRELEKQGFTNVRVVVGKPRDLRLALDDIRDEGGNLAAVATTGVPIKWRVVERIAEKYPAFAEFQLFTPGTYLWPDFLSVANLVAIVDNIVVIAVVAIGMTMVIITAGIDLSVGSLIALSAVISTLIMKQLGGPDAPAWVVPVGFLGGTLACGLVGGIAGLIIARTKVAPFITTLAFMMIARGLARRITHDYSVYQVPEESLSWLGQECTLGIPNTVLLLVILYIFAHLFMAHTRLGRYIYAVGGNEEAARLSGVPVAKVIVFVYVVSGLAAGLGGCIQVSQIGAGDPQIGKMFELYVIAAVVVGGTSLFGGSGRILGTLIGAFIISVIQNGMNKLGLEDATQMIVLGAVILGAVLLDKARSMGMMQFVPGESDVGETPKQQQTK